MRKIVLSALALAISGPALAFGGFEEFARAVGADIITVTRKDDNTYEVLARPLIIKTRYCYEYVYFEDAVYFKNKLYFLSANSSCDVEGVYRK